MRRHLRPLIGSAILCLAIFSATVPVAFAADPAPSGDVTTGCKAGDKTCKLQNPLKANTFPELAGGVIRIFTGVSGSFALLMFVYGGFLWIFSGGNEERISKGKAAMTWATIGLAIIFGAYTIVTQIFKFL